MVKLATYFTSHILTGVWGSGGDFEKFEFGPFVRNDASGMKVNLATFPLATLPIALPGPALQGANKAVSILCGKR